MKKKLLLGFGGLVLLLGLGVGLVLWNINPIVESFRPQIAQQISDAIDSDVELGPIEVRFVPFGLDIRGVSLKGAAAADAARVGMLSLDADLKPLMERKLRVTRVDINELSAVIQRNKDRSLSVGGVSLSKKGKKESAAPATPAAPKEDRPVDSGTPPTAPQPAGDGKPPIPPRTEPAAAQKNDIELQLDHCALTDASFTWVDEAVTPPQRIEVKNLDARIDNISSTAIGSYKVSATVLSTEKDNLKLSGSMKKEEGQFLPTVDSTFKLKDLDLTRISELLAAYGKKESPISMAKTLGFETSFSLKGGIATVDTSFDASPAELSVADKFVKKAGYPLSFSLKTTSTVPPMKVESKDLVITVGLSKIQLPFSYDVLTKKYTATVRSEDLPLTVVGELLPAVRSIQPSGSVSFDIEAQGDPAAAVPKLKGTVSLKDVALGLPIGVADAAAEQRLVLSELNGTAQLENDSIVIKPLNGTLAEQKFELGAKITSPADPVAQLALRIPTLSFGPLLAIFNPQASEPLKSSSLGNIQLAASLSKPARTGGMTLTTDGGTLSGYPLGATKLVVDMALDEGMKPVTMTLKPSTVQIFGGSASINGALSADKRVSANVNAQGVSLDKLMEVAAPQSGVGITGTLQSLALSMNGPSSDMAGASSGTLVATAVNGEIRGVNILRETLLKVDAIPGLSNALIAYIPEKYRPLVDKSSTVYSELKLDSSFASGNVDAKSFTLVNELYRLTGGGTLGKGGLELNTQLRLLPVVAEGMIAREPKLKLIKDDDGNITIPVVIRRAPGGSFVVLPDATRLLKMGAKNTAKEAAGRALDKVAPGLGGALDSLFK